MSEIIERIKAIREQRIILETQEKEIILSLNCKNYEVEKVYREFLKAIEQEQFTCYNQKKMFVYVCTSICCPTALIGDRLKSGIRFKMSKVTALHKTQISHIIGEVSISYKIYKEFKTQADYLYEEIKRSLV